MPDNVCIFWDNSNIFIPAQFIANRREGGSAEREIRIHFENLFKLAKFGRDVSLAVCVGSVPPDLQHVWDHLRKAGVNVELYERGAETHQEQGLDQCLQVYMLRALADVKPPGVAVLLTGDGKGYESGIGYHADLERLYNAGWGIEVISWDSVCNKRLREWACENGVYVPLEDYYNSVTFLKGIRLATPLNMKSRRVATARP